MPYLSVFFVTNELTYSFRAFKKTATTIREVGQHGAIKSLLRSDEIALRLEECQFALSELITLLCVSSS